MVGFKILLCALEVGVGLIFVVPVVLHVDSFVCCDRMVYLYVVLSCSSVKLVGLMFC